MTSISGFAHASQRRAPGTQSMGSGFTVGDQNYFAENYATHVDIPDEVRENQDNPYNVDQAAVMIVNHRNLLRQEINWARDFFKSGVWGAPGTDTALAVVWSTFGNSKPILDLEDARNGVHATTGREATDLTMGREVWTKLKHHPDFLERIKYTQRAIVTMDLIASLLDLQRVNVGNALQITSAEGVSALTFKYIFGKNALVSFVPGAPGIMIPSAGYTFVWKKVGLPAYIRFLRDDKALYDRIEGQLYFDQKQTGSDLGYFIPGAVA